MKKHWAVLWGAVALLPLSIGVMPARSGQSPAQESVATTLEQNEQVQREVQVELARAQAELSRALQEVRVKTSGLSREIAAKLAAHRSELQANLQALQGELAAMAQERATRTVGPLIELQESEGGWLGVQIADVDAQKVKELKLPAERGVLITDVEEDSPAAKGGLKANDVVTEFNGQRIESAAQFRRMVRESLAGRTAQLTVWRDGRAQQLSVTLGSGRDRIEKTFNVFRPRDFNFKFDMPDIDVFYATRTPMLGIGAEDISGQLGSYFGAPDGEGILVREVNSGSPAEKAGMKAGDVIVKVDGARVRSLEELREKLRAERGPKGGDSAPSATKSVNIGVIRKGAEVSLRVELEMPRPPERRRVTRRSAL